MDAKVERLRDDMNPTNSRGTICRRERTEKLLPRLPSVGVMWEF